MCVSVCVCVSVTTLAGERTNSLDFWHGGQVEGYLGQVVGQGHRSKVKVMRPKKHFNGLFNSMALGVHRCLH